MLTVVDALLLVVMLIPIVAIALSVLAALRWRGQWRLAALVPVVFIAAWTLSVVLAWPTDHTLWPAELLLYGLVCLAYMLVLRHARGRLTATDSRPEAAD